MHDSDGDRGGPSAPRPALVAETLGFAMARRAAAILDRHRDMLTRAATADPAALAADDAIFTAVLDAVGDCLGRFDGRPADGRPADDRWCDALFQLLRLAQFAG